MILFITKDLMIQSAAAANGRARNVVLKPCHNLNQAKQSLSDDQVNLLLIDLQTPGFDLADLLDHLSIMENRPQTIAFAQHVEVQLLESANHPMIDQIMTRGQFNRSLPSIVDKIGKSD